MGDTLHFCLVNIPSLESAPKIDEDTRVPSPSKMPASRPSAYEDIEISNIRGVIAKRLGESKVYDITNIYTYI